MLSITCLHPIKNASYRMTSAFYTDDSNFVNRKIPLTVLQAENKDIESFYELYRCIEWIIKNNYAKIALQFPDDLLQDAASISLMLEQKTGKECYILGDTSYGSCCVDEIAAEHASADSIIHFGPACLNPTQRLPVLFIFGKSPIEVESTSAAFRKCFPDSSSHVILMYEVMFYHALGLLIENLKEYDNLVISHLEIPQGTVSCDNVNNNQVRFSKCHRQLILPQDQNLTDYSVFYIGIQNQSLVNCMLALKDCRFFSYNPIKKIAQPETLDINKYLRKRYYYIEKAKDARILGILVGTLGVSNYLSAINHLKALIKESGKKAYTLVVGKLNAAKLANFAEIEIFVNVACSESTIVDCHDFYQPIISPYELEIALNEARQWTGDYITDFSELLPGSAKHLPPKEVKSFTSDVSLITGKIRSSHLNSNVEESIQDSTTVVPRDKMVLSAIHSQAAGEFLGKRSWKGLEQKLGETEVPGIQQGKKGIASGYEDESPKS